MTGLLSLVLTAATLAERAEPRPQEPAAEPRAARERPAMEPKEGLSFADTGPLRIRDQFLLSSGFLTFDPVSADGLRRGTWQIDVVESVTNAFAHSAVVEEIQNGRGSRREMTLEELRAARPEDGRGIVYVDGEVYRTAVALRRGIHERFQLELLVPILNFGGGFLDGAIEQFHDAFDLGQAGRLGIPKNGYTVYVRSAEGEIYRNSEPGVGLGDIAVGAKIRLPAPGDGWHLAVEAKVELPTGDEDDLYGSGSTDLGVQFLSTRYFDHSCLHLGASLTYLGEAEVFGLGSQVRLAGMVGYEHAIGTRWAAVLQGTVSQSPFQDLDIDALDKVSFLVDVGVKRGFGPKHVLFFAISENVVNFDNSPDVGLHLGLTKLIF